MAERSPLLNPDWPYAPRRWSFFYGWVIAGCGALGVLMSAPGQTMGVSVFNPHLQKALQLDTTQISRAYLFGTLASAILLVFTGRVYDRIGARLLIAGSSACLGLTLVMMSRIDYIAAWAEPAAAYLPEALDGGVPFLVVVLGFFFLRFFGQGVLTLASRNMLMEWFDKHRGRIVAIQSPFISFGFSITPLFLNVMIDGGSWRGITVAGLNWRGAWLALAAVIGIGFAIVALVIARDTPESCGLLPDGKSPDEDLADADSDAPETTAADLTLAQARRTYTFWIYNIPIAMWGVVMTAFTFHIVAIGAEVGLGKVEILSMFLPMSIISAATNFIAGWVVDRFSARYVRYILLSMLTAFCVGTTGMLYLHHPAGYWAMIIGCGVGGGCWGVLVNISWARFFGRTHLGAISGLNMSSMVFGSAIGPWLFSRGRDITGTFRAGEAVCLAVLMILLIGAVWAKSEREVVPPPPT